MSIKNVIVISVDDASDCVGLAHVINQIVGSLQNANVLSGDVTLIGGHRLNGEDEFTQRVDSLFQEMVAKAEAGEKLPDNVIPIDRTLN